MSKLKGKNWKEMILGHGEKVVLGIVVLFVLSTVVSARWGTYQKQPIQFDQAVSAQEGAFTSSVFPPEEQAEMKASPYADDLVERVLEGHTGSYEYSTVWLSPIYKPKAKLKEPAYLPVEDLVADAGKVLLELQPEATEDPAAPQIGVAVDDSSDPESPATVGGPAIPDVAGPRVEGPRVNRGPVGPGGRGSVGTDPASATDVESLLGSDDPYGGSGGYPGGGYPGGGALGGRGSGLEARGARFVAIRGVLPNKSLIQSYKKALNAETIQEAAQMILFWDLELQRKTAIPGAADPWAGEWEPVDIQVAMEILDRSAHEIDIVSDEYLDIFTMNLPYRATGTWETAVSFDGKRVLASHPRIKRLLTEKEKDEQEARAAALVRAADEAKALKNEQRGGFSQVQHNTRSLQNTMGRNSQMRDAFGEHYSSMMGMNEEGSSGGGYQPGGYNPNGGSMGMAAGGFNRMAAVATPDLLLFRYFDFSVVPGNSYIYRVRLKLKNPNYDRDVGELDDPAFREGEFRFTPWSEMSNPAFVQDETEMFLARVDEKRGVDLDVYQWMTETGTYVKGPFKKLQRGDRIAAIGTEDSRGNTNGQLETDVLRPVEMTFATEEIDYVTTNTLIDFRHLIPMSPEDHPDLQLGGRRLKLSLDEALAVNQFGELVVLNSASQDARYKAIEARQKKQEELWSHLKNAAGPIGPGGGAEGGIESLLEGYGGGSGAPGMEEGFPGMEGGNGASSRRRRRSSLKRGGGMGGYGSSMGGYGAEMGGYGSGMSSGGYGPGGGF